MKENDLDYIFHIELCKLNDWIKVVGRIEMMKDDGYEYIALRLSECTVLDIRGAEFVSN